MDKRKQVPVVIDPAVRAAEFIRIIKSKGMYSKYEALMRRPIETKRGMQ